MADCMHRWVMEGLQSRPFRCTVVCADCHGVVRVEAFDRGGHVGLDLRPLFYGHYGLGLDDMRSLHRWIAKIVGFKLPVTRERVILDGGAPHAGERVITEKRHRRRKSLNRAA
jgi:hypothetical protein